MSRTASSTLGQHASRGAFLFFCLFLLLFFQVSFLSVAVFVAMAIADCSILATALILRIVHAGCGCRVGTRWSGTPSTSTPPSTATCERAAIFSHPFVTARSSFFSARLSRRDLARSRKEKRQATSVRPVSEPCTQNWRPDRPRVRSLSSFSSFPLHPLPRPSLSLFPSPRLPCTAGPPRPSVATLPSPSRSANPPLGLFCC